MSAPAILPPDVLWVVVDIYGAFVEAAETYESALFIASHTKRGPYRVVAYVPKATP